MLRIEVLRKELGLSQQEFAEKVNMTQQRISAYEKGKREPDIESIKQFADFFDVSIDFLLGHSDIRKPSEVPNNLSSILNKEASGLSVEEVTAALKFYKDMKNKIKNG